MGLNCSVCHNLLPDESRYCIHCGAYQDNGALVVEPETALMRQLAAANLHRIRGDWAEAEFLCTEVLRADPENVSAHSLLGDVFRDQGRLDDACQWYQLALDLDPNSRADRLKLDRLNEERKQRSLEALSRSLLPSTPGVGTGKLAGIPPVTWIRVLTAVSAALFVILLAVIITFRGRVHHPSTGAVSPNPIAPIQSNAMASPIIPLNPSSAEPSAPILPSTPARPTAAPSGTPSGQPAGTASEENQMLLAGLNQMLTTSRLGEATSIQIYPSLKVAEVSLEVWDNWPNMNWQGDWTTRFYPLVRTAVMRSAAYSARYLLSQELKIQSVQVTASTWMPNTLTIASSALSTSAPFTKRVIYIATFPRGSIAPNGISSLNEGQLEQLSGKSATWDPALKPPATLETPSP